MFKAPEDFKLRQDIVDRFIENQKKAVEDQKPFVGEPTGLKCSCGGDLAKYEPLREKIEAARIAAGKPRHAKTFRLQKKFHKAWVEKHRVCLMGTMILGALGPPKLRCLKCGRPTGFYQAMAHNMFKIEPMPQGAVPVYDRDVSVASILDDKDEDSK